MIRARLSTAAATHRLQLLLQRWFLNCLRILAAATARRLTAAGATLWQQGQQGQAAAATSAARAAATRAIGWGTRVAGVAGQPLGQDVLSIPRALASSRCAVGLRLR